MALLATSCGSDDGSGAGSQAGVEGREFWSTLVTDGGEPRALVDGTRITLRFNGDQIGASAGCNSMGGTFGLEDSTLTVSDLFMTEIGCDPSRHDQDDFVASALMASPTIKLDGNSLTLTTSDATIQLLDTSVANPDREIIGNLWTVTGFIDGQTASSFTIDEPGRIEFLEDSTLSGFDGCADFSAPVEVSDGSTGGPVEGDGEMQFGVIGRTPTTDCANPEYVEMFHQLFATGEATFTINGTNLTMVNSNGAGVTLKAR
jgi:heat shock protein HslJ